MKLVHLFAACVFAAIALPAAAAEQFDLGGAAKGTPSTVDYTFLGVEAVAVFVRGPGDLLYANVGTNEGADWTNWSPIGTLAMKGDPSCAARSPNRIDCAAVGPNSNIYWTSYDAKKNAWTGWASLGGLATSNPSVVATHESGKTQLRIFVRGPSDHLFMNTLNGNWSDWKDLKGTIGATFSCGAISTLGAHCYDSSGGKVLQVDDVTHKTGNDVVVEDLGGIVAGKVSAASSGGVLRLYVSGPGQTIWGRGWSGSWTDWINTNVALGSAPGCAMSADGTEAWCASVGADGKVTMNRLN